MTVRLPGSIQRITEHGAFGVQLFFVMSAFTLAMSLHGRAGEPLRNFFIRRFFRIAPMYYCALFYYLCQDGLGARYWLGGAARVSIANIASTVFFVNGFNSQWINSTVPGGWSIAVEMNFYVMLPLLMTFASSAGRACKLFFAVTAFSVIACTLLWFHGPIGDPHLWSEYLYFFLPSQLPIFCLGIVLYYCVRARQDREAAAIPLLAIAALVVVDQHTTMRIPEHIAFAAGFACVAYCLSIYPTKILVNRWTVLTGKLSFSLYLIHFAVLHFAASFFVRPIFPIATADLVLKFAGCVCVSTLVAYCTYRVVELPGQALGAAIISRLSQPQPVLTTAADA